MNMDFLAAFMENLMAFCLAFKKFSFNFLFLLKNYWCYLSGFHNYSVIIALYLRMSYLVMTIQILARNKCLPNPFLSHF